MNDHENISRIKVVYKALDELAKKVVFVGGAAVSLYADRAAGEVRPTEDIDILVEIWNYNDYALIDEKLKSKGFQNDVDSGVICRYRVQGVIVDVIPTSAEVLGFSNKWYTDGLKEAAHKVIGQDIVLKIFSAPYFIASKLEAYKNRGENDGRTSTDFEDLVFLMNNRTVLFNELANAPRKLKQYLKEEFSILLAQKYLEEWISAHLDHHEQRRVIPIIGNMEAFVKSE